MSTPTTAESFNTLRGMFGGLLRSPKRKPSPIQSVAQQAVLNNLRAGGTIKGAQPNNPLAYAAQLFDPRRLLELKPPTSSIPTLRGGMVGGREALIAPGGWNADTAGLGEITVGGQRFFPAQSGKDLVYQRAPGQIGGQYGSIRVPNQLASSSFEEVASTPEERAYRQELLRTAQLTAQDPELQRYERARSTAKIQEEMNAVRDEGMRIWAAKHGGLAAKVKPGSTGYEAIQGVINPATASFLNNEQVLGTQSFDPNTALSTAQQIQGQFRPNQALTDQEILAAQSYDPNIAMSSAGNIAFAPSSPAEAGMLKAVGGAQGEYITPMSTTTFANPLEQRKAIFQELLNRVGTRGR